jgi:hypothetical protein
MTHFTESVAEDAAFGWSVGHGPEIAPSEPAAERSLE